MKGKERREWVVAESGLEPMSLEERPRDGDQSLAEICDGLEGCHGKINRVAVDAGGACISNGNDNTLVVLGVSDPDLLSAEARSSTEVAVAATVDGSNQVIVAMEGATSTGITVLVVECGESTGIDTSVWCRRSRCGRLWCGRLWGRGRGRLRGWLWLWGGLRRRLLRRVCGLRRSRSSRLRGSRRRLSVIVAIIAVVAEGEVVVVVVVIAIVSCRSRSSRGRGILRARSAGSWTV
jgi:hypothetical protein